MRTSLLTLSVAACLAVAAPAIAGSLADRKLDFNKENVYTLKPGGEMTFIGPNQNSPMRFKLEYKGVKNGDCQVIRTTLFVDPQDGSTHNIDTPYLIPGWHIGMSSKGMRPYVAGFYPIFAKCTGNLLLLSTEAYSKSQPFMGMQEFVRRYKAGDPEVVNLMTNVRASSGDSNRGSPILSESTFQPTSMDSTSVTLEEPKIPGAISIGYAAEFNDGTHGITFDVDPEQCLVTGKFWSLENGKRANRDFEISGIPQSMYSFTHWQPPVMEVVRFEGGASMSLACYPNSESVGGRKPLPSIVAMTKGMNLHPDDEKFQRLINKASGH